jgi:site-specific recombinase XerD
MDAMIKFGTLFFIRRTRKLSNGLCPIYIRITVNGQRQDVAINRSVDEKHWCPTTNRVLSGTRSARQLNQYLDTVKMQVANTYRQLMESGKEVTARAIKNTFMGKPTDEDRKRKMVLKLFREHNEDMSKLAGKEISPATCTHYATTLRHLTDFMRDNYSRDDLPLEEVTPEFISKFELFLKSEKSIGHNTAMKYLKNFKKVMRIAQVNGWLRIDPFAGYKMPLKKVDRGFLDERELQTLIDKTFGVERLNIVKDSFLFSCFTGLAYSDLKRLTTDNIHTANDGQLWIHTQREKTGNSCHIPLLPVARAIMDKYRGHPYCEKRKVLLPVISNQKMNAYLKEIADLCGIRKNLTSHLARHTFATTVTLNNDVPIETVSKMLGHSSIDMTRTYARLLDKKVDRDMSKLYDIYK